MSNLKLLCLISGVLLFAFNCKKAVTIVTPNASFNLNAKKGYTNLNPDLTVVNTSVGMEKFEWYIDNNFISNTIELSKDYLKNTTKNIKHELKLICSDKNGNRLSYKDSFSYSDTFSFNEIGLKNISSGFYSNIIPIDTNFRIGISVVKKSYIGGVTIHNPPNNINILPHCWSKSDFISNDSKFFNRIKLGSIGLLAAIGNKPFYIDNSKILDFQVQISSFNGKVWGGSNLQPITKVIVHPQNHELSIFTSLFEIILR